MSRLSDPSDYRPTPGGSTTIERSDDFQRLSRLLTTIDFQEFFRKTRKNAGKSVKNGQKTSEKVSNIQNMEKIGVFRVHGTGSAAGFPGVGAARETGDTGRGRWMVHGYPERENGRCMALHGQKLNIMFSCGS